MTQSKLEADREKRTLTINTGYADTDLGIEPPDEGDVRKLCHQIEDTFNCVAFGHLERDIGHATRMVIRVYVPHHAEMALVRDGISQRIQKFRYNHRERVTDGKE